jgi:hypothetical protein
MKLRSFAIVTCLLAASSGGALGQSLEDRLRDQLRQTTDQLHQLQDSQAALQAQKTAAEQERDALKKQVAALQVQLSHKRVVRDTAPSQAFQQEIAKDKQALAQASSSIQEAQADHDRIEAAAKNQAALLSVCEQKNSQLFQVSNEILDRFGQIGVGDALKLSEPFAQQTRVQLEQMAQDYGDRIYDGKFDPRAVKVPAAPPQPASSKPPASKPTQAPVPNSAGHAAQGPAQKTE